MCGITGIVDLKGTRPIPEGVLRAMNGVIGHRGPDGDGFHIEPGVGLRPSAPRHHRSRRRQAAAL